MASATRSPRYRQFLERLRTARKESGMTQLQVAKQFRRPQSFISKCESGERRVDVVELEVFARLYDRPLTYFLPPEEKRGGSKSS